VLPASVDGDTTRRRMFQGDLQEELAPTFIVYWVGIKAGTFYKVKTFEVKVILPLVLCKKNMKSYEILTSRDCVSNYSGF